MICTFFRHRDTPAEIRPLLRTVLLELIEQRGVDRFCVGCQGNFDAMARELLRELERSRGIRYEVVLAALPKQTDTTIDQYHTLLPEGIENAPPRFAIDFRNRWMVDRSDIVVTYVRRPFGGAAKFKELAEKKKKAVIELSNRSK